MILMNDAGFAAKIPSLTARGTRSASTSTSALRKLAGALMMGGLALGGLTLGAAQVHAADTLKVGISAEPYPPFTYTSASGEWTGFEVELANAICDAMQRECEITPTGWSGIIPSLKAGRIDMIMNSMTITNAREKVIDFSIPYYHSSGAYVAASDLDIDIPEGLDGMVLGAQAATTHANFARRALRDSGVQVRLYDQQEQANSDLFSGRVDVILADEIAMNALIKREEAHGFEIKATTPQHPAYGEGVGIGIRKEEGALKAAIDDAIQKVYADGTCTALSNKYFDTDVCLG
ncbi:MULTISPECIES: transporter substrate-binding domain-containing protein [Cobetia]|uniref:Transporter substrate-binding domain-containing protein n=1 Tax=Cobetia marina TaxID=28258 RepID=A0ABU9GHB4_COBMA|nr:MULTISPECIES: transporter substrate-binding domain-containing protein [Cobetia]MDA5562851.1 transporter substrate-binding domain-containing protein [Cobetia sp. MMG027]